MEETKQVEIPEDLKTLYYTSKNNFGIVETSTVRLMTLIERIGRAEAALRVAIPYITPFEIKRRAQAALAKPPRIAT